MGMYCPILFSRLEHQMTTAKADLYSLAVLYLQGVVAVLHNDLWWSPFSIMENMPIFTWSLEDLWLEAFGALTLS